MQHIDLGPATLLWYPARNHTTLPRQCISHLSGIAFPNSKGKTNDIESTPARRRTTSGWLSVCNEVESLRKEWGVPRQHKWRSVGIARRVIDCCAGSNTFRRCDGSGAERVMAGGKYREEKGIPRHVSKILQDSAKLPKGGEKLDKSGSDSRSCQWPPCHESA